MLMECNFWTLGQLLGFRVFPITLEPHLDELPDSSRLRHRANSATSANPSKSSTFSWALALLLSKFEHYNISVYLINISSTSHWFLKSWWILHHLPPGLESVSRPFLLGVCVIAIVALRPWYAHNSKHTRQNMGTRGAEYTCHVWNSVWNPYELLWNYAKLCETNLLQQCTSNLQLVPEVE